ncbi:MAG: acyltransferase [Patescibacteria group bacterium]
MPLAIVNAVTSTYIFGALLVVALFASLKKKEDSTILPISLSQELKGFAMLAIIFAHVGYFLVNDHQFLFPLSILAGVGVDLFLFLSGFGLAVSALKKTLSPKEFYLRHLPKLYVPFWVVLAVIFTTDFVFLHITRSWQYIAESLTGFFPHADLFQDVNSPLWYFTFILFFYLLFPILFSKKRPILSALLIYAAAKGVLLLNLPLLSNVEHLYKVHAIAFPLGVALGGLYGVYQKRREWFERKLSAQNTLIRASYTLPFLALFSYFAYFSGVGTPAQEYMSLFVMFLVILIFILKPFRITPLYLFGILSYELYLIHWPLMSRYDILFHYLPAWLAMALYLPVLLGVSWCLHKVVEGVLKRG